ncbi:MAG: CHAD domain-containing protein [Pseudolabrys sp.]|nr:CHAD domain-containing protein [Pseudolabrys sp.]
MKGAPGYDEVGSDDGTGQRLTAAARAILADARAALSDPKLTEAEAVHDVRKASKRWRALMRLLSGPLGKPADAMRGEARDLMRALSGSRDGQAALDALTDLRKSDLPVSETSMKTIEARLTKVRGETESASFTPELRQRLTVYLDLAERSAATWPLDAIDFGAVADELTVTYQRARQLMPDDWYAAEPEHLHDLRKRVVEHRHQMELVEPLWPRLARVWAQEAQRLRERLGSAQDLAVFEGLMAPRQILAPWRSRLTPLIADRRMAHLKASAKLASRLFAEKPKAFRSRLGALWKAKEDSGEE